MINKDANHKNTIEFQSSRIVFEPFLRFCEADTIISARSKYYTNGSYSINYEICGNSSIRTQDAFRIIFLNDTSLIIEVLKNSYCFEFDTGKLLSKNECIKKEKRDYKHFKKKFGKPMLRGTPVKHYDWENKFYIKYVRNKKKF